MRERSDGGMHDAAGPIRAGSSARGSKPRRRLRMLAGAAIVAMVAAALPIARAVVGSEAVGAWLRPRIMLALASTLDAEVEVRAVSVRGLFPPEVVLDRVLLTRRDGVVVAATRVIARPSTWSLLRAGRGPLTLARVVLETPEITADLDRLAIVPSAAGLESATVPHVTSAVGPVTISALEIRGGRATLTWPSRDAEVSVGALDARIIGAQGVLATRLRVAASDVTARLGGRRLAGAAVGGAIDMTTTPWRVTGLAVDVPDVGQAVANGTLDLRERAVPRWYLTGAMVADVAAASLAGDASAVRGTGLVTLRGSLTGAGASWRADGDLASRGVALTVAPLLDHPFSTGPLEARVSASPSEVVLDDVSCGPLGGAATGHVRLRRGDAGWVAELAVEARDLDVRRAPAPPRWQRWRDAARTRAGIVAQGAIPLADPASGRVSAHVTLSAAPGGGGGAGLAVAGEAEVRLADGILSVKSDRLAGAGGVLAGEWSLRRDGSLEASLHVDAPDGSATIAQLLDVLPELRAIPGVDELSGALTADVDLRGTLSEPELSARVAGVDLAAHGLSLGALAAQVDASPAGVRMSEIHLHGPSGELAADVAFGWASSSRVVGSWSVDGLDVDSLARVLAVPWPVQAVLSGSGTLGGSGAAPTLAGNVRIDEASVAGIRLGRVAMEGSADVHGLTIGSLSVDAGAGTLQAEGSLPWRAPSGRVTKNGGEPPVPPPRSGRPSLGPPPAGAALPRPELAPPTQSARVAVKASGVPVSFPVAGRPLAGVVDLSMEIGGSVASPRLTAPAHVTMSGATWWGTTLPLMSADARVEADEVLLDFGGADSGLTGEARVARDAPHAVHALARLDHVELGLPAIEGAAIHLGEVALRLDGALSAPDALVVDATAASASLVAPTWSAMSEEALHVAGTPARLALDDVGVSIAGERARLRGDARLLAPARATLELRGALDLRVAASVLPGARVVGVADVALRLDADPAGAALSGGATVADAYVRLPGLAEPLRDVRAELMLDSGRVRLTRLEGVMGDGPLTASGEGLLDGIVLRDWQARLHGLGVTVRVPPYLRALADLDLAVSGCGSSDLLVSGAIDVIRGRSTRSLASAPSLGADHGDAAAGALAGATRLAVRLSAEDGAWVSNDLLEAQFRLDLDVLGTLAEPILVGEVDAVPGGKLRYRGAEYDLLDASASYAPYTPEPEVDVHARTHVGVYEVQLAVSGRLSDPQVELSSEPDLPQERLVALLLSGGVVGGSGAGLTASVASGIDEGLLPADPRTGRRVGLDRVVLDPVFVDARSLPPPQVTFGKQFSHRLFGAFTVPVGGEQGLVELRYRATKHGEWRLAHEQDGSNAGEARWVRSYTTGRRAPPLGAPPGGGEVVATLAVAGAPDPPGEGALRDALGLAAGAPATRLELLSASARAKDLLADHGLPLARVRCVSTPAAAESGAKETASEEGLAVDVACRVEPGPRIALTFVGLDSGDERRVRKAVRSTWAALAFGEDLVGDAALATQESLLARGRANATVRARSEEREDGLDVTLDVTAGPIVHVDDVAVVGASLVPDERLLRVLSSRPRLLHGRPRLTPALLDRDRQAMTAVLRDAGLLDATVAEPEVAAAARPGRASLTFAVDEGVQARLASVSFDGNTMLSDAALRDLLHLQSGDVIRPAVLEAFARDAAAAYDALGHPDATLSWRRTNTGGGATDLAVRVDEGPLVKVGAVRVEGNRRTRDQVVRREVRVASGDLLTRKRLGATREGLRELGTFQSVMVRGVRRLDGTSARDVVVRLRERDDLDLSAGAGLDDEDGGTAAFSVGERNVAGRAASVGFQLRVSRRLQVGRVLGGLQHVGGSPYDVVGAVGAGRDVRRGFTVSTRSLAVQASRPAGRLITLFGSYRIEDVTLSRVVSAPAARGLTEGIIAGVGLGFVRDTRDDPLGPRHGSLSSVELGIRGRALGSDFDYLKLALDHVSHLPVGRRGLVLDLSLQLGASWPSGRTHAVPFVDRFFAGGVSTLRGFPKDGVGPRDGASSDAAGGEGLLLVGAEWRIPVRGRVTALAFLDAGNVYDRASAIDPSDLRLSVGPGVAIATPIGPLRLYQAWKLDRRPGESGSEIHFALGATF